MLGLISLIIYEEEKRVEIKLLAVSKENRGAKKQYGRIAGNLIGFACREATRLFGIEGCVSLVPKTELKQHYMREYRMKDAGCQIYLDAGASVRMLIRYEL